MQVKYYEMMKGMFHMRKLLSLMSLLLVCMLLPVMVLAQTQEEWNLSCNYKTSCATSVLATGTREPKGTIPANTYVKITGTLNDDLCIIQYMINGQTTKGVVSRSNLIRCTSQYRKPDGWADNVHELDPEHDKILESNTVILVAPSLLQDGDKEF